MDKSYRVPKKKVLVCTPCSSPPRRNIVAEGMKRFEGIGKISPPQPSGIENIYLAIEVCSIRTGKLQSKN